MHCRAVTIDLFRCNFAKRATRPRATREYIVLVVTHYLRSVREVMSVRRGSLVIFLLALCLALTLALPLAFASVTPCFVKLQACTAGGSDASNFLDDVADLFVGTSNATKIEEEVYLGGYPLGMTMDGEGVTVIGLNEFFGEDGNLCCPALVAGLEINDVILQLDGRKIHNSSKLSEIASKSQGEALTLIFIRDGRQKETKICAKKDLASGRYRLGLWTKDASGGVGTLTYVRKNLSFGSLGHPITSADGEIISCKNGGVFKCTINGVEKGRRGAAGELKGSFSYEKRIGNLVANNRFGAFGSFASVPEFCVESNLIPVADVSEAMPGKAEIFCTLDDNVRKSYQIEIVKTTRQSTPSDKGMVIHVTDPVLLEKTGGIVQGMSGSPIVQNGKLVGAVTHVFVNDPTRGYGIYAKWMLEN